MSTDNETARIRWADAVADANNAADAHQAAIDTDQGEFMIERRRREHEESQAKVDTTYRAYLATMGHWIDEAPKRWDVVVVGAVATIEDRLIPAVTFGFRGGTEAPVTVTLVNTEIDLRRFQKKLDKAITDALREVRKAQP